MTENWRPIHPGATRHLAWPALLLAGVLLQACGQSANGPGGSRARVFAADMTGAARSCDVPRIGPASGQSTEAAMKVGNDGGWCGLQVHQDGPKPFDAGLLTARPAHGSVLIHEVGDDTRIDYTPDRGFIGNDSFSVKLVPGNSTIRVAVIVAAAAK
jgi:hypothetical protein